MVETTGSRLKQLRMKRGLKQKQLASLLGLTKTTISYYENDSRQPTYSVLIRLADIFNVSTDYLLCCERSDALDISGLTTLEQTLIRDLVEDMRSKNKKIHSLTQ